MTRGATVTAAVVVGLVLVAGCVLCAVADCKRCQGIARLHDSGIDMGTRRSVGGIERYRVDSPGKTCRVGVASTTHAEAAHMPSLIGDGAEGTFFEV